METLVPDDASANPAAQPGQPEGESAESRDAFVEPVSDSAEAVAEPDNGPDPALMVASSADAAADDADEATPQPPAVASVADAP
ncbi:MAG TPA: hypothetical protein VF763_07890, partial [Candidatus Limnocylindrales bacterium]